MRVDQGGSPGCGLTCYHLAGTVILYPRHAIQGDQGKGFLITQSFTQSQARTRALHHSMTYRVLRLSRSVARSLARSPALSLLPARLLFTCIEQVIDIVV